MKVHNPAGGQAPHRNLAHHRMDIGRNCEKRDAALHDLDHPRGGKLPPGAPVNGATTYHMRCVKYLPRDMNHIDMMINSAMFGIEGTAEFLADLVRKKYGGEF